MKAKPCIYCGKLPSILTDFKHMPHTISLYCERCKNVKMITVYTQDSNLLNMRWNNYMDRIAGEQ